MKGKRQLLFPRWFLQRHEDVSQEVQGWERKHLRILNRLRRLAGQVLTQPMFGRMPPDLLDLTVLKNAIEERICSYYNL